MKSLKSLLIFQIVVLIFSILLFIVLLGVSTFKFASSYERKNVKQISSVIAGDLKLIVELYPTEFLVEESMEKIVNEIPALDGVCIFYSGKKFCYPKNLSKEFTCAGKKEVIRFRDKVVVCLPVYEEYATELLGKKKEGYFLAVFNDKYKKDFEDVWIINGLLISVFFLAVGVLIVVSWGIDLNTYFNRLKQFITDLRDPYVTVDRSRIEEFRIKELRDVAELIFNLTKQISKLNEYIKKLAITDPLTGLFNRNYLDLIVKRSHVGLWKREKFPVAVALLDIDDFKSVNDIFGHVKGDEVLCRLGKIIKENLRAGDIPIRFGGEEILIIFPSSTKERAVKAIKRIRKKLVEEDFGIGRPVTFSSGISDYPSDVEGPEDLDKLIDIADKRLYEAKRLGKNRDVLD